MAQNDPEVVRSNAEQSARRRANLLGVRYFDTRKLAKLPLFDDILSVQQMYELKTVVLSQENGAIILAITAESPQHALNDLKQKFRDLRVSFVMISEAAFKEFMLLYDPPVKVEYKDIDFTGGEHDSQSIDQVSETLKTVHADDMFNYLVRQAKRLEASDVHLETGENDIRIRFRVDGVLHEIARLSYEKYRQLNSTIAIEANISSSDDNPQTGHIKHAIVNDDGEQIAEVNMRIETVPTTYGQDAVLRLFNMNPELLNLKNLGLRAAEEEAIDEIIAHPTGLVLSVGPTGSGKTTTLYSIINKLNSPERKIITLEDPVEYTLPGIVQIPVNTKEKDSFANKLRAVLRLDPDVVMIGEIRDADTARTALQASLSGHLVLATFHASDTTTALSRLYGFLGDNPLLTSAIRLIVAQRLVRKLDENSREHYQPEEHVLERARDAVKDMSEDIRPNVDEATFYKAGTSDDAPFGYIGQSAIVELLSLTPKIEKFLHAQGMNLDPDELREMAMQDGMVSLLQNAVLKASEGETSLDEVFRVVG